jgi:hypothetical protein
MKNNNTTVDEYYENVMKAAKTLEEYYEKMANFTPVPENKKTYQMFRREMRDLWKTHAAY